MLVHVDEGFPCQGLLRGLSQLAQLPRHYGAPDFFLSTGAAGLVLVPPMGGHGRLVSLLRRSLLYIKLQGLRVHVVPVGLGLVARMQRNALVLAALAAQARTWRFLPETSHRTDSCGT